MAIQSNLLGNFWGGYGQRRAARGVALSRNELLGMSSATLDADLKEQRLNEANRLRKQALNQQNEQFNKQAAIAE